MTDGYKKRSFWRRPEGVTGALFIIALLVGAGILVPMVLGPLITLAKTTAGLIAILGTLGVIIFLGLDPKLRNLVWYMYKSTMRWITGLFVQIDPIGILKSYMDEMKGNLRKMQKQIVKLRGQMHKLKEMMLKNQKEIQSNLKLASKARASNKEAVMILKSRKAGRLRDSNMRLEDLYKRMEVLYRVLVKMHENSSILLEDVEDQVRVKEQERKAIHAGHSAMKSAMSIIKGDKDKRAMFDEALEAIADDVSQKVGEMERFMEMSENFMSSIDLQNGVFEEKGLQMLEKWEKESTSLLLGSEKASIILEAETSTEALDLNAPVKQPEKISRTNQYDSFFD